MFARVSPVQKHRIIHALKHRGHVVGYMGDGINDAPSLHAADVGISVASAVDVARDAADIILLKPGLGILHNGILEGPQGLGERHEVPADGYELEFRKHVQHGGRIALSAFLPMLPTQILLNNFLYDTAQITIPTDNVDEEYLRGPRRWDMKLIRNFMIFIGPISSIYDFLTFYVLLHFLPRQSAGVPHRMVRRIARDTDTRALRHSHDGKSIEEPAERSACDYDGSDRDYRRPASLFVGRETPRFHYASDTVFHLPRNLDSDVSPPRRMGETTPLRAARSVSALGRARARIGCGRHHGL